MVHPWRLVVARLPPATPLRDAVDTLGAEGFGAVVRSAESVTVVREVHARDQGLVWRALEIAGPFAFSETGVLAALAEPLAAAGVSIFAVNSYETDFVLVPEVDLERAREAIARAGHQLG
ncbi:ACT domain-containing protein [Stagnimonas aquatica]|uniref:ACT domain-containing protein n=2 Tax=Stagnimonas aquatica TaxID=2689987 RepID=A0A3N0VM02_9GAMM|nr:ACT domain-containing protein [Stagnimonas aquatica]